MSKEMNPVRVGLFTVVAVILAVVGTLILAGGRWLDRPFPCVMYFEESIAGLDVGAPVEFLGVRVGTVTDIRMVADPTGETVVRPVYFDLEPRRMELTTGQRHLDRNQMEETVVKHGMRAQLAQQSLLTGKLKIELSFQPETEIKRRARLEDPWEVPTIPSPRASLQRTLNTLPLDEIVMETHRAITAVADLASDPQTRELLQSLNGAATNLNATVMELRGMLPAMRSEGQATLKELQGALADVQKVMQNVEDEIGPFLASLTATSDEMRTALADGSPLREDTARTLEELRGAARELRNLTEYLQRHPEAVVHGKP